MSKAQTGEEKPDFLWFNGRIVPWQEGTVHVWSELAIRGVSVFEGIRVYWNEDENRYYLMSLDRHIERLWESARLLRIPVQVQPADIVEGIYQLLAQLDFRRHAYVRPTLYIDEGRYGYDPASVRCGDYVVSFPVARPIGTEQGISCAVSSWRRASDLTLPPRAKSGAAYQAFRLPLMEARERGFDDAILLNDDGKVAEATGAAIFMMRRGVLVTPPVTASILESITRERMLELAGLEASVPIEVRPVDRTELYVADEVFICGTLAEVQPVVKVDDLTVGDGTPGPLTRKLRDRFISVCEAGAKSPFEWLTPCP